MHCICLTILFAGCMMTATMTAGVPTTILAFSLVMDPRQALRSCQTAASDTYPKLPS